MAHPVSDGEIDIFDVSTPTTYWVRCSRCLKPKTIHQFLDRYLIEHWKELQNKFRPQVGDTVCVLRIDDQLSRGRITSVERQKGKVEYTVYLVDFRKEETVSSCFIYPCELKWRDLEPQTHLIGLYGLVPCQVLYSTPIDINDVVRKIAQFEHSKEVVKEALNSSDAVIFNSIFTIDRVLYGLITLKKSSDLVSLSDVIVSKDFGYKSESFDIDLIALKYVELIKQKRKKDPVKVETNCVRPMTETTLSKVNLRNPTSFQEIAESVAYSWIEPFHDYMKRLAVHSAQNNQTDNPNPSITPRDKIILDVEHIQMEELTRTKVNEVKPFAMPRTFISRKIRSIEKCRNSEIFHKNFKAQTPYVLRETDFDNFLDSVTDSSSSFDVRLGQGRGRVLAKILEQKSPNQSGNFGRLSVLAHSSFNEGNAELSDVSSVSSIDRGHRGGRGRWNASRGRVDNSRESSKVELSDSENASSRAQGLGRGRGRFNTQRTSKPVTPDSSEVSPQSLRRSPVSETLLDVIPTDEPASNRHVESNEPSNASLNGMITAVAPSRIYGQRGLRRGGHSPRFNSSREGTRVENVSSSKSSELSDSEPKNEVPQEVQFGTAATDRTSFTSSHESESSRPDSSSSSVSDVSSMPISDSSVSYDAHEGAFRNSFSTRGIRGALVKKCSSRPTEISSNQLPPPETDSNPSVESSIISPKHPPRSYCRRGSGRHITNSQPPERNEIPLASSQVSSESTSESDHFRSPTCSRLMRGLGRGGVNRESRKVIENVTNNAEVYQRVVCGNTTPSSADLNASFHTVRSVQDEITTERESVHENSASGRRKGPSRGRKPSIF